jgi:predicted transcriptional regulator
MPRVHASTPVRMVYPLLKDAPAVLVTEKGVIVGIVTKADLL